jgi:hypothetical protein
MMRRALLAMISGSSLIAGLGCTQRENDFEVPAEETVNARLTVPVAETTHASVDTNATIATSQATAPTPTPPNDAELEVADATPKKLGTLENRLVAKGENEGDPSIETQVWCGFDPYDYSAHASKRMSATERFSNLPAISQDGETLAFIVEDGPEGIFSHGASLRIDSRAGVVLRTLRLWSYEDDDRTPSSDPASCGKAKARLERTFASADAELRRHPWRRLETLPKTWKVLEKHEPFTVCGTCKLDWVTVRDPDGTVVLSTDPSVWLATHTPKDTSSAAVPGVTAWLDPTSKLLVLGLYGASHADTGPGPSGLVMLMQPY